MKLDKIYIIWQFDPRSKNIGGVGKYVISFAKEIYEKYEVVIVGVTKNAKEVGKLQVINLDGFNIFFLPVCTDKNIPTKSFTPLLFKFVLGLNKFKNLFDKRATFFLQRFEYSFIKMNANSRYFVNFHYDISHYLERKSGESYWKYFPSVYKYLLKKIEPNINGFFSVNNQSCHYLKRLLHKRKEIYFFPTWADSKLFYYETERVNVKLKVISKFDLLPNNYYLLSIGRINKSKNLMMLLTCIVDLPENFSLIIVGDGPYLDNCIEFAKQNGIQNRVLFLGRIEHYKIKDLYVACDLYVSTSLTEGMSIALMESLACGTPALTFNTGEASTVIQEGLNGLIVHDFSYASFLEGIRSMYSQRNNFIHKNISDSISKFSAKDIISSILEKFKAS
ncbi:glycosyltransferase [Shewanella sp. MF05960]|uniref:glycosyltransferase n=1 Tax=Shewanella sp. MF05960 TaxID=3434874 RepID=UPI003D7A886F